MIKGIIFDYGGVVSEEPSLSKFCEQFAAANNIDATAFKYKFLDVWSYARLGEIRAHEFWLQVATSFNVSPTKLKNEAIEYFKVKEDVLDLIKKLKRNNYKIALLTNNIEDLFEETAKKYMLKKYFDVLVTSYETKLAKPDPLMYKRAVRDLGLNADDCLFIDDVKDSLMSAQKLGMHTILFRGIANLKTELMMYGIKTV